MTIFQRIAGNTMTKHIKDFLSTIVPKADTWQLQLVQQWETIIGNLTAYVYLEKIHDDTLLLGVTNTSWMQELYYLSDVLLKKINTHLNHPHVKQLRFKYSPRKKNKIASSSSSSMPTECQHLSLTIAQQKALEQIQDPQLQEALKNFLVACYKER